MKKFLLITFIAFSTPAFSATFLLKCDIAIDDSTYETLYFFNKVKRFTGYFVFSKSFKNIDVFHRRCNLNQTTSDKYTYRCKGGDYKFSKSTENLHAVHISRKDLSLSRGFEANMKYTGRTYWGDNFNCVKEGKELEKERLNEMQNKVKERDKRILDSYKEKEEGNQI